MLAIFDKLSDVLTEQRERRICHYNIRLLQQFYTFRATEITVTLKVSDADVLWVWNAGLVIVPAVFKVDGVFSIIPAEQVTILILVAGGDELLEAQFLKVVREVVEEVADPRIVAVQGRRISNSQ